MTNIKVVVSSDISFNIESDFTDIIDNIKYELRKGDERYNIFELMNLFDRAKSRLYSEIKYKVSKEKSMPKKLKTDILNGFFFVSCNKITLEKLLPQDLENINFDFQNNHLQICYIG